jgi:16S rRNA (guanine966-N2)-methyltransferase
MRVVAGNAGGLTLKVPKSGVRPTMDRVKAAIFSMAGDRVIGARVLDLFAGSGGLGIEALSRGAASAEFVERDREAAAVIRENLERAKCSGAVHCEDVFRFLKRRAADGAGARFDLVFADPPYASEPGRRPFTVELLESGAARDLVLPGGWFVVEKHPAEAVPEHPGWELFRRRRYGATEVLVLERGAP